SPSHSAAAPRWRIVAPTSQRLPPETRAKLVARVDGFMKSQIGIEKVAANESFTLSQAYYYGWVMNKPGLDHRVQAIIGDFIDLRDDLAQYEAAGAKFGHASNNDANNAGGTNDVEHDQEPVRGFEAILGRIGDGDGLEGFNGPLSRAAASYVALHNG